MVGTLMPCKLHAPSGEQPLPALTNHYQVFDEKLEIHISVEPAHFKTLTINFNCIGQHCVRVNGSAGQGQLLARS